VAPKRQTRAELDVLRLAGFEGRVSVVEGPPPETLGNILVRLLPTGRYTTTDGQGRFAFYNLPEGDYEAALDGETLPEYAEPAGPGRVPVRIRHGEEQPAVDFRIRIRKPEQPMRKIFERQITPERTRN